MNGRIRRQIRLMTIVVVLFGALIFRTSSVLGRGVFDKLLDARMRAVREDIQEAIREAEALTQEGHYIEALRLLFDARKKEQGTWVFQSNGEFSHEALDAIWAVERRLIYEDQSPLMRWFRDPEVPLQERVKALAELRRLAGKKVRKGEDVRFRGKYDGILVQLVTSRRLRVEEKNDVLKKIYYVIQESYVSTAQQERIVEEIAQFQREADRKFQAQQYVEAFVLMDHALQKTREVKLDLISPKSYDRLYTQRVQMRKKFVHADESPLMQVFKDRDISTRERQYLLYELREMLINRSVPVSGNIILRGKEYDGTFVQILTHPQVEWDTKEFLLISIDVEILKKEPDYTPEHLLGLEEYFKKKDNNNE